MPEQAINIGEKDKRISCVLHSPTNEQNKKIVVVFMHGWAGYRIGPHQMFVKYARKFSEMGYYCMRFDFRGRGYSAGIRSETNNQSMLFDLEQVISYLQKNLRYDKIVLLGICSGAKLALYYAKSGNLKIDGVIEMSSSLIRQDAEAQINISRKKNNISHYLTKEKLIKLVSGKVELKKLVDVPFRYISFLSKYFIHCFRADKSINSTQTKVPKADTSFKNYLGESFLLIHGEKDPETDVSLNQITALLKKHNFEFDKYVITGANHSFYSVKWEIEIFDIIKNWMLKHYSLSPENL